MLFHQFKHIITYVRACWWWNTITSTMESMVFHFFNTIVNSFLLVS